MFGQLQRQFNDRVVLKGGAATQLYFPISLQRNSVDIDVISDLSVEEFESALWPPWAAILTSRPSIWMDVSSSLFSRISAFIPTAVAAMFALPAVVSALVAESFASPAFCSAYAKICSSWARNSVSALEARNSNMPSPATPATTNRRPRYQFK